MNPGDPRMDGFLPPFFFLLFYLSPSPSYAIEQRRGIVRAQSENPGSSSEPVKAACHCVFRIRPIEPRNSVNGVCIDHRLDPLPAKNSTANNYRLFRLYYAEKWISSLLFSSEGSENKKIFTSNGIGIKFWLTIVLPVSRIIDRHSQKNLAPFTKKTQTFPSRRMIHDFRYDNRIQVNVSIFHDSRIEAFHTDSFIKFFHWNDGARATIIQIFSLISVVPAAEQGSFDHGRDLSHVLSKFRN